MDAIEQHRPADPFLARAYDQFIEDGFDPEKAAELAAGQRQVGIRRRRCGG